MSSDTSVSLLSSGGPLGGQSFAVRAAGLTRSERASYRRVLEHFVKAASPLDPPSTDTLARVIERDLLQTDGNGRVTVAYPFSAAPTRHRVVLSDGRDYYAMCAIDALGIPYMLDEHGEVQALEPDGQQSVRVAVVPDGEPTWTPAQAVAVTAFAEGCCLAQSACPHINLFASAQAAAAYLHARELEGSIMSITDAAAAGRWLFGDLLHSLAGVAD
jgi:hypothetical protein